MKLLAPRARLPPRSFSVRSTITGLSQGMLEGETTSSNCRAMKATRSAFLLLSPRTWRVALRHHSSCARKACCQKR